MRFANATDPGRVRTSNQDTYYSDPEGRFFIVADGMGGHAAGATASLLAVEAVRQKLEGSWSSLMAKKAQPTQLLVDAVDAANQSILEDQRRNPERADMGTTVVALLFDPHGNAWSAHIGDSRLYRLRDDVIEQMTEDHTLVSRFIRQGDLLPEQARTHSLRHVLERCLGRQDTGDASVQPIPVRPGDRFLLCSDGLTEELSDSQIAEYVAQANGSPETFDRLPEILIEAAKARGGRDNITVVIAEYS